MMSSRAGNSKKLLSIIIPCFNGLKFTRRCLRSIFRDTTYPYELIVVDNGSIDGTGKYLRQIARTVPARARALRAFVAISNRRNRGVAAALNQAMGHARGSFICYLNNDTVVTPLWAEGLIACAQGDGRIGIVGCKTNVVAGKGDAFPQIPGLRGVTEIRRSAAALSMIGMGRHSDALFVHGFCMLIKRSVVRRVGRFDERFYPCGGEDLDYCLRARRAGFRLVNARNVFVYHFGSKATRSAVFTEQCGPINTVTRDSRALFVQKWGTQGERFYQALDRQMRDVERRSAKGGPHS